MDELQALITRLHAAPHGELRQMERKTGVAYSTIRRIRDGVIKNPGIETVKKLAAYPSVPA